MKKYAFSLTSAFTSPSILKARIMMLYQKPSATLAFGKYALAIPILVFCVLLTAFTQRKSVIDEQFRFLKRTSVKPNAKSELRYIFTKKNEYLFRFVDAKTGGNISLPKEFKVYALNTDNKKEEVKYETRLDGFYYAPEKTAMHILELQNTAVIDVDILIYFKAKEVPPTTEENGVFQNPEILPAMPLYLEVTEENNYPTEAKEKEIEGEVIVGCIVDIDGSLRDIKIEKGLGYGCDELALEKVRNIQNISAGKHKGKKIHTKISLRVAFNLFPMYFTKPEIPQQILQTIPLSTVETSITLEKGKKYIFTFTELESLTKEELKDVNMSLEQNTIFQYAFADMERNRITTIYRPKETGVFKIKLGKGKPIKAGKLIIGTK